MTAALRFHNLTLGYDRHPAVHHLDGEVAAGALIAVVGPNGAGKSTLFKGIVGALKPLAGAHRARRRRRRATSPICRRRPRSTAAFRSTSTTWWRWACGAAPACSAASAASDRDGDRGGDRRGRPHRLRGSRRSARCRAARCSACCSRACCCRTRRVIVLDEPFTAIDAKTSADLLDLVRRWHGEGRTVHRRAARPRFGARALSRDAAARARAGGLGADRATC